jgi:cytochrome c-type biogenesis protein CcmH
MWRAVLFCIMIGLGSVAQAVEPGEMLEDPVLEARARILSKGLRCLVCRNESIDESNADLARDLALLVRERMVAGDSDDAAIAFIVARYGEFVLLQPSRRGANIILWAAGPVMLVLAVGFGSFYLRRRAVRGTGTDDALTEDEARRLQEILRD